MDGGDRLSVNRVVRSKEDVRQMSGKVSVTNPETKLLEGNGGNRRGAGFVQKDVFRKR